MAARLCQHMDTLRFGPGSDLLAGAFLRMPFPLQEMTADSLPGIRGHGSRYFNFVSVAGCRSEQRPRRPACRAHEVQPSRSPVGRPWRCHAVRTPAPKCPRKRLFCPPCWRGPRLSVVPLSSACRVKSRRKQGLLKTSSPLDPHFLV